VPDLVNTVKELEEDRTAIAHIRLGEMPTSPTEHMTEAKPVFFDEHLEAIKCSVVRI